MITSDPARAAEIISRYFDAESAPENDAALAELVTADPDVAGAFASPARLHAMLQQRVPRRRSRTVWKWIAAGSAAALSTAAALTFIPRTLPADSPVAPAGENWQPVETATVP